MNRLQADSSQPDQTGPKTNSYPPWSPRIWTGMRLRDLYRLLAENRFRVHPVRVPMMCLISGCASVNSLLAGIQNLAIGRKIHATEIEQPPLFIVGHWRTGTTLVHELFSLDDRFGFPSTFDCFGPHHFLMTGSALKWPFSALLPKNRPMDNMSTGIDLAQEDEFALCTMGAPTPYRRLAFPNQAPPYRELFDMKNVDDETMRRFREAITWFYKCLTRKHNGKRLVLKSPPHTGRIEKLSEWFPGAQFIHLARHPYNTIPSTLHLWRSLDRFQGFELVKYTDDELLDRVLDEFEMMYDAYFDQRTRVDPKNLVEYRFEDVIKAPESTLQQIYLDLNLPDFAKAKEKVAASVLARHSHKMNPRKFDRKIQDKIDSRMKRYMQEFGYFSDTKSESPELVR